MHHGVTARKEGFFARFGKRQNDDRLRHRQEPLELLARGGVVGNAVSYCSHGMTVCSAAPSRRSSLATS